MSDLTERYSALFAGDPLDGTRLAAAVADSPAGRAANARLRMEEWRADLRRRVEARRA